MATNRYSNGSVSKFNPMSFQEVMFAPSMMRQKHDGSIAAAEAMRIKADPLKVHEIRALQLKQEMDSKISSEVDKINKEGFNANTTQNITRLNREYQDLIAPTGEVGQINAAKQVYAANLKEYIDDATKNKGWSREDALYNWQNKFANQYTGFGEDGKSIENIGQYGAPKKVEIMEKLKDTKALLGEQVVNEIQASGYGFAPGPDGSMIMIDRSGRRIETSNKPNLAHALNLLRQQFNEKEWSSSREFGRENEGSVMNQVVSGVNTMLKTGVVDNRGERAQYIAGKEGRENNNYPPTGIFDPDSQKSMENKLEKLDISAIGKPVYTGTVNPELGGQNPLDYSKNNTKRNSYKNALDPSLHVPFESAGRELISKGVLPEGTNLMNINQDQAKQIADHLKSNYKKFTVGNDIILPDRDSDKDMFMGQMAGTDNVSRNKNINADLDRGTRKLINPETGIPFTSKEWKSFKDDGGRAEYYGYDSPINMRGHNFENSNEQQVMAHQVTLYNKNGQPIGNSAVQRTPQEMSTPEFRSSYNITHSYRNSLQNPGKWMNVVDSKSGNGVNSIKGIQVMYNDDGTMSLKKGTQKPLENITPQKYMQVMYDLMLPKQK